MTRKPGKSDSPIAALDQSVFAAFVRSVFEQKHEEIRQAPRYRDAGYHDGDDFHERGGFWNDNSGRAADGYTKQDVQDVRKRIAEMGLSIGFDALDGVMNEFFRTGRFALQIKTTNAATEEMHPKARRTLAIKSLGKDRYRVGDAVVTTRYRHARCSCRPETCDHVLAVRRQQKPWPDESLAFDVPEVANRDTVRFIARQLRSIECVETLRLGRKGFSSKQRALALILRHLFPGRDSRHAEAAAQNAGFFKTFPSANSLASFRKDAATTTVLQRLFERINAKVRTLGLVVPEQQPVDAVEAVVTGSRMLVRMGPKVKRKRAA